MIQVSKRGSHLKRRKGNEPTRHGPHHVAQKSTTSSDGGDFVPLRRASNSAGEFTVLIVPMLFSLSSVDDESEQQLLIISEQEINSQERNLTDIAVGRRTLSE